MINVTKPFLPPEEEYISYIRDIFKRNWLTNNGPLVNELELKLKSYLDLPHILLIANGTVALQIAIKCLGLKGDIITTPFSYIATTSSIVWEQCNPVFVDIDALSLNIDADKIEASITENTSAILATHVYGNPCNTAGIEAIAKKHKLSVIYDAAHAFGTQLHGRSLFSYGDIAVASFHATKLFHTTEGGAVFTSSPALTKKMAFMRNFGHNGPEDFAELGINGKVSELHAAMGLVNLKHVDAVLEKMKLLSSHYDKQLTGLKIRKPKISENTIYNHAYYPVIFETEKSLLKAVKELEENKIFARRYFYPPLHTLRYVKSAVLPVTEELSKRVLCLPLYFDLTPEEINFIARILLRAQNN